MSENNLRERLFHPEPACSKLVEGAAAMRAGVAVKTKQFPFAHQPCKG
jgi:hypothetical protein